MRSYSLALGLLQQLGSLHLGPRIRLGLLAPLNLRGRARMRVTSGSRHLKSVMSGCTVWEDSKARCKANPHEPVSQCSRPCTDRLRGVAPRPGAHLRDAAARVGRDGALGAAPARVLAVPRAAQRALDELHGMGQAGDRLLAAEHRPHRREAAGREVPRQGQQCTGRANKEQQTPVGLGLGGLRGLSQGRAGWALQSKAGRHS